MNNFRVLSPSPVQEIFSEIRWNDVKVLELTTLEQTLLSSGEANPIEYTLSNNDDAVGFVRLLLKVLDQVIAPIVRRSSSQNGGHRRVSQLGLDGSSASGEQALDFWLEMDATGVVKHFCASKLCEVVDCIRSGNLHSISMESIFFPNGFLIEGWHTLTQVLEKGGSDVYTLRGAAFCMANILIEGLRLERNKKLLQSVSTMLNTFITWMTSQLQSSGPKPLSIVLPSLMILIPDAPVREAFDRSGGIGYLTRHLRYDHLGDSKASVQQMYELCFCLWIMSYDVETSEAIRNHFHRDGAVNVLCDLVAQSPREKVVRCALATLRNLATCKASLKVRRGTSSVIQGSDYLVEIVGCGLMKSLGTLRARAWKDPDIVEDLDKLYSILHEAHKDLSRFDVYKSEIEAGHLQWGLVHTEKFFKENAKLMEGPDGDFALVKRLISLIKSSHNDDVIAIACYDLGEFVRHYSNGRAIAKRLGGKEVVLQATEHQNPDVQTQALLCVSKILIQNWSAIR